MSGRSAVAGAADCGWVSRDSARGEVTRLFPASAARDPTDPDGWRPVTHEPRGYRARQVNRKWSAFRGVGNSHGAGGESGAGTPPCQGDNTWYTVGRNWRLGRYRAFAASLSAEDVCCNPIGFI